MPPKPRNNENTVYPKNWRVRERGSKFYILFRVPKAVRHLWGGKGEATLGIGDTLPAAEKEAYLNWAQRIACGDRPATMGQAFDRYEAEVVSLKSPASQKSNRYSLKRLRLGIPSHMLVTEFRTHHAHEYRNACAQYQSRKKANLDLEVLSHVFTKCLEWGSPNLIEHPIVGKMKKLTLPSRTRYVQDWELAEFLSVATPLQKAYVPLKQALGIDKSMMLRIQIPHIKAEGLEIEKRSKIRNNPKAKRKLYPFKDADGEDTGLRALLDAVKSWRADVLPRNVISPWLFCAARRRKRKDGSYVMPGDPLINENGEAGAFDQAWQESMARALANTKLAERFTEHDLCAKTASDAESDEEAARLRGHLNTATTAKVYRRKPVVVMPHKTEK